MFYKRTKKHSKEVELNQTRMSFCTTSTIE